MSYKQNREELTSILLDVNKPIFSYEYRILELVPELIVCSKCEHEHPAHIYNVYIHILHVVDGVHNDLVLKLAALFHDIGKPYVKNEINGKINYRGHEEISEIICRLTLKRLGYKEDIVNEVCKLVLIHDKRIPTNEDAVLKELNSLGKENFERFLSLKYSDVFAHAPSCVETIRPKLEKLTSIYNVLKEKY